VDVWKDDVQEDVSEMGIKKTGRKKGRREWRETVLKAKV